jgi:hypothetical protein
VADNSIDHLYEESNPAIVASALLAGCRPRQAGSDRSESIETIHLVMISPIADNIARAVNDGLAGQDREMEPAAARAELVS